MQKDVENYKTVKYSDITKEKTGGLHSIGENNRILNLFRYIKIRLNPCYIYNRWENISFVCCQTSLNVDRKLRKGLDLLYMYLGRDTYFKIEKDEEECSKQYISSMQF